MKHFVLTEFECDRRQSTCALKQQACCCNVLTTENCHTWNNLSGTRHLSHALPTLTKSVLRASGRAHSRTLSL